MKIFGYPASAPLNEQGLREMREVTFAANPRTLRRIAAFLLEQAARMEAEGRAYGHAHAQDEDAAWSEDWPDIIVVVAE